MDMIGRNEEKVDRRSGEVTERAEDNLNSLHLVGTEKLSKDLHRVCLDQNAAHVGFEFEYDEEGVFGRSDHANFARKDIPIAFFFTGFHPQYHKPDDTIDKIDFPKLARVARLVYAIAFEIADRDERVVRDRKFSEIPQPRRRGR
jgi:Zn-dependent M28 family amino/carboxypeptidase